MRLEPDDISGKIAAIQKWAAPDLNNLIERIATATAIICIAVVAEGT